MDLSSTIFEILPTIQTNDWGKRGSSSKVAQLAFASPIPGFKIEEKRTYAELWMGTHPTSPSSIRSSTEDLSKHLAAHPKLVSTNNSLSSSDTSNGQLPFLLKVLSIGKILSIQMHPDEGLAAALHADSPDVYTDPNHKPEMAVALTYFTGLCGFLPLEQIAKHIVLTPELAALIPTDVVQNFVCLLPTSNSGGATERAGLKSLFSAFINANSELVKEQLTNLVTRFVNGSVNANECGIKELVLRLNKQWPGDIGAFFPFLLNYLKLSPGQACFLGAGEPHAYISGDIVECMAASHNVIRAGLTSKVKDIPNFVNGLTYSANLPSDLIVQAIPFKAPSTATVLYDPPATEFCVLQVLLKAGEIEIHPPINGPSIAVVIDGRGTVTWSTGLGHGELDISNGTVFFVAAGQELQMKAEAGQRNGLHIFRAFSGVA